MHYLPSCKSFDVKNNFAVLYRLAWRQFICLTLQRVENSGTLTLQSDSWIQISCLYFIISKEQKCGTFSLKALLSQDADESEELCDLFEVKYRRVVELDDGQRLFVIGTAGAVLHEPARQTEEDQETLKKLPVENVDLLVWFRIPLTRKCRRHQWLRLSCHSRVHRTACPQESCRWRCKFCWRHQTGRLSRSQSAAKHESCN